MHGLRLRALVITFAILLWSAVLSYGHAILLAATPAANSVVKGPDVIVKLRFNSRIDQRRSRLLLLLPGGNERALLLADARSPDSLTSEIKELPAGSYILRWQVLSIDGHISRGEVAFRVQ